MESEPKINVRINVQHKHLFTIANILHSLVVLDIDSIRGMHMWKLATENE